MARSAPSIDSYGGGGFRLSGAWHAGSLLIVGDEPQSWGVRSLQDVTPDSLAPVLVAGPAAAELLLLGVGLVGALPARAVREAVRAAGLGFEFMDTASAARLYNVLTSEGRQVAAALIAI